MTPNCSKAATAVAAALMLTLAAGPSPAQTTAPAKAKAAAPSLDARIDTLFVQSARSKAMLRMLVQKMPKGGDLHNHATGGIYAEDFITWGAEANACFSPASQRIIPAPCAAPDRPLKGLADTDPQFYSDVVDALSTRRHDLGVGDPTISGHRRFFRSFGRFGGGARGRTADVIAVSLQHAALDNSVYLELMQGPSGGRAIAEASLAMPWNEAEMEGRFSRLQPLAREALPAAIAETDMTEAEVRKINGCDTPKPSPACDVTLRYLLSMGRSASPQAVFAQMAFAFALVDADPRYVGVNIVAPEDGTVSTRDYSLHMRMFAFYRTKYPNVKMTLHAGELALGLVDSRDLKFHIKEAVEVAGAKRIGHGVDIAYEDGAAELLQRMARDKIAVEINLTSNDVILGVKGAEHPLALYMAAGVPIAISTDDAGVSRSDLTNEYLRAITEQGLSYTQLRQITRNSLTYAFIEGDSLWQDDGKTLRPACPVVAEKPAAACQAFLKTSAKAREQWRLELKLKAYERALPRLFADIPPSKFPAEPAR